MKFRRDQRGILPILIAVAIVILMVILLLFAFVFLAAFNAKTKAEEKIVSLIGVAELEGHKIPALTGKIGLEDHLRTQDPCEGGIGPHRGKTNETDSNNNFLCSGGAFGAVPPEEEPWYINMRWRYAEWAWNGTSRTSAEDDSTWYKGKKVIVRCGEKSAVLAIWESGPAPWAGTGLSSGEAPVPGNTRGKPYTWEGFRIQDPPGYDGRVSGVAPTAFEYFGSQLDQICEYGWSPDQTVSVGPLSTTDIPPPPDTGGGGGDGGGGGGGATGDVRFVLFCATDACSGDTGALNNYAVAIQDWYQGKVGSTFTLAGTTRITGKNPASYYGGGSLNTDSTWYNINDEIGGSGYTVVLLGFRSMSNCGVAAEPGNLAIVDPFQSGSCPIRSALAHELGHSFGLSHVGIGGNLMRAPGYACSGSDLPSCTLTGSQIDYLRGLSVFK